MVRAVVIAATALAATPVITGRIVGAATRRLHDETAFQIEGVIWTVVIAAMTTAAVIAAPAATMIITTLVPGAPTAMIITPLIAGAAT